jgi:hypothetical protein
MNSAAIAREPNKNKSTTTTTGGVVYRTVCQNPGCGHAFDLRITPLNAGLLSGTMPCPRCHRRGGMLKSLGRIRDKVFAAKLMYRTTGVGPVADDDERSAKGVELPY